MTTLAGAPTTGRKRARWEGDTSAGGGGGDGDSGAPLTVSALGSGIGSSLATPFTSTKTCTIASHARLEALLKQTELLRRLDAEAHETMKAEWEDQVQRLQREVDVARAAAAVAMSKAGGAAGTGADDMTPPQRRESVDVAALAAATGAAAEAQGQVSLLSSQVDRLRGELRDAQTSYAATIAKYEEAVRVAEAAAAAARASANVTAPAGGEETPATSAPPTSADVSRLESELSRVREALRASERRERAAQADVKRANERAQHTELVEVQLAAAVAKATRLEEGSQLATTLAGRLASAASALDAWLGLHTDMHGGGGTATCTAAVEAGDAAAFDACLVAHAQALAQVRESVQRMQAEGVAQAEALAVAGVKLQAAVNGRRLAQRAVEEAGRERDAAVASLAESDARVAKLDRAVSTLTGHVAALRQVLSTYEQEYSHAVPSRAGEAAQVEPSGMPATAAYLDVTAVVLHHMQQCNAALLEQVDRLPSVAALTASQAHVASLQLEVAALRSELDALYVASTPRSVATLLNPVKEEASVGVDTALAARLGATGGDVHSAVVGGTPGVGGGTKVVHMVANPTSTATAARLAEWKAVAEGLKVENERLRQLLTAPPALAVDACTPITTAHAGIASKLEELRAETAQAGAAAVAAKETSMQAIEASLKAEAAAVAAASAAAKAAAMAAAPPPPPAAPPIQPPPLPATMVHAQSSAPATLTAGPDATAAASSALNMEKMVQRLKNVFKERMALMKDMVYRVTGYRVDVPNATVNNGIQDIIVRSIYFDKEGDHLMFQYNKETDVLVMTETDLSRRLDPTLMAYARMGSLPAYTAAITLNLFEKTTVTAGDAGGGGFEVATSK